MKKKGDFPFFFWLKIKMITINCWHIEMRTVIRVNFVHKNYYKPIASVIEMSSVLNTIAQKDF